MKKISNLAENSKFIFTAKINFFCGSTSTITHFVYNFKIEWRVIKLHSYIMSDKTLSFNLSHQPKPIELSSIQLNCIFTLRWYHEILTGNNYRRFRDSKTFFSGCRKKTYYQSTIVAERHRSITCTTYFLTTTSDIKRYRCLRIIISRTSGFSTR